MRRGYKRRGKIFKRLLVLLTAVFLFASTFVFVGCSSGSSDEETWSDFF